MKRHGRAVAVAAGIVLVLGVATTLLLISFSSTETATPPTSTVSASSVTDWPNEADTGVAQCGPLTKVENEGEINLSGNSVYEGLELLNPAVIQVRGAGVTIRCVKYGGGTGYFGIDNTHYAATGSDRSLIVDRVEIDCRDGGQLTGLLVHSATISDLNVHRCEDGIKVGGDDVVIRDSYCHDLTNIEVAHSDCIQSYGDNRGLRVEHNSLWGRDTSDFLMGQEGGDSGDVVIHKNRFMSIGSPAPAFLLYVSGTNTTVTDNRFSRRYTYGPCTLTTGNQVTWSGNTWDDDGSPVSLEACR